MAMKRRFRVEYSEVAPKGWFVVGDVEPILDYDAEPRSDGSRRQATDPESGLLMWSVPVLDADPDAGRRDKTISVKIAAKVQPVPPANETDLPVIPVEFVGLEVTPWIDDSGLRPRIAWSFRATDMVERGTLAKSVGSSKAAA